MLLDNFLTVIILALFFTFPLVLKISPLRKIVWNITNYIFLVIYFSILGLFLYCVPDLYKISDKVSIPSPSFEYINFKDKYFDSDKISYDDYYVIILSTKGDSIRVRNTQFATTKLVSLIFKASMTDSKKKIKLMDSLKKSEITYDELAKHKFSPSIIPLKKIDSMRVNFNKFYYQDIKTTDSLIKISKFESNKHLFKLYNYKLRHLDSLYKDAKFISKMLTLKQTTIVKSDSNNVIFLYDLKDDRLIEINKEIEKIEKEFEKREDYSNFLFSKLFYPIDFIIDHIDF